MMRFLSLVMIIVGAKCAAVANLDGILEALEAKVKQLSVSDSEKQAVSKKEAEVHALASADADCCVKLFGHTTLSVDPMLVQYKVAKDPMAIEMCFPIESPVTLSPMCFSTDPDATQSFTRRACDYEPDACLSSRLHFKAAHTNVIVDEGTKEWAVSLAKSWATRYTMTANCKKIRLFDNDDDEWFGDNQDPVIVNDHSGYRGAPTEGEMLVRLPSDLTNDVTGFCVYY